MNIRQAESKIITVVKSIVEIFREISTFPGSFQANSARFTTAVTLDVFFLYTNLSGTLDTVKGSVLQIILWTLGELWY